MQVEGLVETASVQLEEGPTKAYKFITADFPDRYDAQFEAHIGETCLGEQIIREGNDNAIEVQPHND
jgi:hypothetical protein